VLTTHVQALALSTRHALSADWSLHAEAGQTRERFDDPTGFTPRGDSRVRNAAAALSWTVTPQHELQFGLESRRDRFDAGASTSKRETNSARIGWLARLQEAWQVQAHLRHDRSSDFGDATTGLLVLGYTLSPQWKASASISTGFSAPSFSDQAFDADPSTALRAERSRQVEVALQWRKDASALRAALFAQRQRDRIQFDSVTFDATNIARARNRGLELMAQAPLAGGSVSAELTLQDPRNADNDTPLLRRAKQSLALSWQGSAAGWDWRAALRHSGKRADFDPLGTATNGARSTLGLGVVREVTPQWRAALAIDNALDTKRPEVLGYTAPPRAVVLSLQGTLR
jgi:vitamin B12 transporter